MNGMPVCIHGDGSNSRHFIFVTDVANAFDTIMHKGVDGEVYNIGCDDEFTNLEVAKKLVQAVTPGISDEEVAAQITHVEDRAFNDVDTTSTRASCRHSAGSARSASRRGSSGASTGTK